MRGQTGAATRSESVSIVAATSAEGGQVHCTERVRRRTSCGAASVTNAIEPVHGHRRGWSQAASAERSRDQRSNMDAQGKGARGHRRRTAILHR